MSAVTSRPEFGLSSQDHNDCGSLGDAAGTRALDRRGSPAPAVGFVAALDTTGGGLGCVCPVSLCWVSPSPAGLCGAVF